MVWLLYRWHNYAFSIFLSFFLIGDLFCLVAEKIWTVFLFLFSFFLGIIKYRAELSWANESYFYFCWISQTKELTCMIWVQGFSGFLVADWAAGLCRKGGGAETFYGIELVEELKCRRRNWLSSSSESTMGQILVPSATRRPPL